MIFGYKIYCIHAVIEPQHLMNSRNPPRTHFFFVYKIILKGCSPKFKLKKKALVTLESDYKRVQIGNYNHPCILYEQTTEIPELKLLYASFVHTFGTQ